MRINNNCNSHITNNSDNKHYNLNCKHMFSLKYSLSVIKAFTKREIKSCISLRLYKKYQPQMNIKQC